MSLKAIQQKWYEILKNEGFEDQEDHEAPGIPLKKWSGYYSIHNFNIPQTLEEQAKSNFPEPILTRKEEFLNSREFDKACAFLCNPARTGARGRPSGFVDLTVTKVNYIWERHCNGDDQRTIGANLKINHVKVHRIIATLTEWMNVMDIEKAESYDETPQDKVKIKLRAFDPAAHIAFVYSTWRNALFYAYDQPDESAPEFYRMANRKIKRILATPGCIVRIAGLADDPDHIAGYSVMNGTLLEWVYVKEAYRKQGIAKALCKGIKNIVYPYTQIGLAIAEKKDLKLLGDS